MLKTARAIRTSRGLKVAFDVEIAGMATAVPGNSARLKRRAAPSGFFLTFADYEALFAIQRSRRGTHASRPIGTSASVAGRSERMCSCTTHSTCCKRWQ